MRINRFFRAALFAALLCATALCASAADLSAAGEGDYVFFGRYRGSEILWRVAEDGGDSLLLISERVLCFKPFDGGQAAGDGGSGVFGQSDLCVWLNSDGAPDYGASAPTAAAVSGGLNAYDGESGFLSGFSSYQKAQIEPAAVATVRAGGAVEHEYFTGLSEALANYAEADKTTVSASVFLPSVAQMIRVYEKGWTLAKRPTYQAAAENEYGFSLGACAYWLRTPMNAGTQVLARTVDYGREIGAYTAWYGSVGVAPALYIKKSAAVSSGRGSEQNPYIVAGQARNFADLGDCGDAAGAVDALYELGAVDGVGDGLFMPRQTVKRADFVLMLMRAVGEMSGGDGSFADVDPNAYYASAVAAARQRGYIYGDSAGLFNPDSAITKQEAYTIAARVVSVREGVALTASEQGLNSLGDADLVASYARGAVELLIKKGVVSGMAEPAQPATRLFSAELIYRAIA